MRTILIFLLMISLSSAAYAETIKVSVNGMVCAFCATGIEKTFHAQPAVEHVKVDLESKLVTVDLKPKQQIDDATVTKLINDAGYSVTTIVRNQ